MTDWPPEVPTSPQVGSLTGGPDDTVSRNRNDVGPPVTRNRFTGFSDNYSFSLEMSKEVFEDHFKPFFHTDLGNGALPFDNFPDPVTDDLRTFTFAGVYQIQSMEAPDAYIIQVSIVSDAVPL